MSDLFPFHAMFQYFCLLCRYHRFFSTPTLSSWATFHWAALWTPWREHLQGPPTPSRLCTSFVPVLMASSISPLLRKVPPAKQPVTFASGAENWEVAPPPRQMDEHSLKLTPARARNLHGQWLWGEAQVGLGATSTWWAEATV